MIDIEQDYSEVCDYIALKKNITNVLKRHFKYNDSGDLNLEYDPTFSAQDAINDIHDLIGDI